MGFKSYFADIFIVILQVLRRATLLVVSPYKTMRMISFDGSFKEVVVIFLIIGAYFLFADHQRSYIISPVVIFFITILHYLLTALFFAVFKITLGQEKSIEIKGFLRLFAYSLIPTTVWFYANSSLYVLLPPPRTESIWGEIFSIAFISFSISILFWKIIVLYLAVRFSTSLRFFSIMYAMSLYIAFILPYSFFLYALKLFRIPFL
jgi:hypothetical protein